MSGPVVAVAMLAYGEEAYLGDAVRAVLASEGVDVRLILVDNGCTSDAVRKVEGLPGLTIVRPGTNTGFAGGCNLALKDVSEPLVALVNSDAIVQPDALAALAAAVTDPGVGIVTASVRLAADPDIVNAAGNPISMLGVCWAGGLGEPAAAHAVDHDAASASGAALLLSTQLWRRLGGFDPEYFAYHEDADLSIRCWQLGLRVRYVAEAVVLHHYHFSRNPNKWYLLERNRLLTLLTDLERRTLLLLAPALLAFELAITTVAALQGWAPAKLRGWRWLLTHPRTVIARRRTVQAARVDPDRLALREWTGGISPGAGLLPSWAAPANLALQAYWAVVCRLL